MPKKPAARAARPARPSVTLKLPLELLEQIEAVAQRDERPRSKVIEFACREYVQRHQRGGRAA